ncbi:MULTISPECIES: DUF4403 family protein [unclassified Sphingomonas]|uniref:DUF4403 family protein n=1 Tax=unclassified Sphingomonas TaxID=196159 RepID=UPI0003097007|nr:MULTISPECIES: DUF4403 family protein [unclassified Sphingomonas]KTF70186.1 hypothetical protein ATB93_05435 [Sphingomonas sp. WG]
MSTPPLVRGGAAFALGLALASVAACSQNEGGAPPRARDPIVVDPETSTLTVPVEADLANLAAALDRAVPRRLWEIDAPDQPCVAAKRVDLGIATVKTPKIKCRIVGEVTRGPMRIGGEGQTIRLAMPLRAVVRAEDIGGILKRETATAQAMAHAVVNLSLAPDWSPQGRIDIRYDWQDSPHIDFLGQRIDFTEQAERKLAPVIARLERELPRELGKLKVREQVGQAWAAGFTTLSLNRRNPPVWMRVTPKQIHYGGYELEGNRLRLRLGLTARTETFVGERPADPKPTPLPPMQKLQGEAGKLAFFLPVIASYSELEPVLMKALVKRSARPFEVPGVGPVNARFERATIYGTKGGRVAVGLLFTAEDPAGRIGRTRGTVWLTATPANTANSRKVEFHDLAVSGTTDMTGGDLILQLINAPGVAAFVAGALTQNFEKDFAELLGKVDRAIAAKREGPLRIRVTLGTTRTGQLRAFGQGLYLPVWAEGTAAISVER